MEDILLLVERWSMTVPDGALVLCALSGGRDSMALLHLLSALSQRGAFRLAAAHYNHRLRSTADRDERFVRDWCQSCGIPLFCGSGDVRAFAREAGTSLEDAARTLRYRFLEETAAALGASRIATAHHQEDNAETVLLHLLRGSGLRGLGGIPPARGKIVRPLLDASRADIDAYIARHHIPYVEDETNAAPFCARNRLRLEVMPLLEELFPGCASRIASAGALLREEDQYLQREAERSCPMSCGPGSVTLTGVWKENPVPGRRIIRSAARHLGVELDRSATEKLWTLPSGGFLNLPGGLEAFRSGGQLTLRKVQPPLQPLTLRPGGQRWGPWRVVLTHCPPGQADPSALRLRPSASPLSIAAWDGRGRMAVKDGSRTIKRLFQDRGIPVERRQEHPALFRDGRPVAVFGVAVDWEQRPEPGEPCIAVSLLPVQK